MTAGPSTVRDSFGLLVDEYTTPRAYITEWYIRWPIFTVDLVDHRARTIRLEGNCDERGTREYNLALGQRRADSVKDRLKSLGVSGDRIETISNGKEKPRNPGHDESAWAENRRVDIVYK